MPSTPSTILVYTNKHYSLSFKVHLMGINHVHTQYPLLKIHSLYIEEEDKL